MDLIVGKCMPFQSVVDTIGETPLVELSRIIRGLSGKILAKLDYLQEIYPELGGMKDEVNRFYSLLPELSSTLSNIVGQVEYNEDELNRCEEKLSKLNRLKSKYKVNFQQLLQKLEALKQERDVLVNMDFSITDKQKEVDKQLEEYKSLNLHTCKLRLFSSYI